MPRTPVAPRCPPPARRPPRAGFLAATLLVGGALAALALAAPTARAQNNRRGGPRVIQLDEIRIEGRVQKPNAFYILNRSNLGYEVEDLRANFMVRNVLDSVSRDEF